MSLKILTQKKKLRKPAVPTARTFLDIKRTNYFLVAAPLLQSILVSIQNSKDSVFVNNFNKFSDLH